MIDYINFTAMQMSEAIDKTTDAIFAAKRPTWHYWLSRFRWRWFWKLCGFELRRIVNPATTTVQYDVLFQNELLGTFSASYQITVTDR